MHSSRWVVADQIADCRSDGYVHRSIPSNRDASRIHFGGMHPPQIVHRTRSGIEPDELRAWIGAGVHPAVRRDGELPEVFFGCRRFTDLFNSPLRRARVEAED